MFIAPLASSFVSPPAAAVFGSPRAGQPRHRERTSVGFHRLRGPAPFNTLSMGVDDASTAAPLPIVRSGYGIFGALSCISWYICADFSLATHATLQLPWIHNAVCIGQALTQLPLLIAFCAILAEAGQKGWVQLARLQTRRINLGLAFTSLWFAACVYWAPIVSGTRVTYPAKMLAGALAAHLGTALFALSVWAKTPGVGIRSLVSGTIGSLWAIAPQNPSADPRALAGRDGRSEFALLAAVFAVFTSIAIVAPFPLGGSVPSILGRRMGRAYGGWMLMTTTAFFVLKTAAEQGTRDSPGDTMIAKLRAAIASASIMHLLLIPGRLILEPGVPLYPGAFAVPWWSLTATCAYVLAVAVTTRK